MPIISNSVQNNSRGSSSVSPRSRSYRSGGATVHLQEGQTLKGVVSDVHGNEITLSMEDGSSFTGKLPDANQYSIGQKAAFQITSLDNNTIYMKALTNAYLLDMEDTIEQALEEANLPKTPRNLEVVRSLLQNQQSISRSNILDSIRLCARFPEADVNSVITMNRLGMPLNDAAVRQFESYQNQTHQLLYKMDALTDSISNMLTSIGEQVPRLSKEVATQLLGMALEGNPTLEEGNLAQSGGIPFLDTFAGESGQAMVMNGQGSPVPVPVSPEGNPLPVILDINGNIVPATDANGNAVITTTDANGNTVPAALDAKGNIVPAALDAEGNILAAPDAAHISSAPDAEGNITASGAKAYSNPVPVTLDAKGNILPASSPEGAVSTAVDANGNPVNIPGDATAADGATENASKGNTAVPPETGQNTSQNTDTAAPAAGAENAGPFSKMRQFLSSITDNSTGKNASSESNAGSRPLFIREQAGAILTPESRAQFSRFLSDYPVPEDIRQGIQNGTATARQILTELQKAFPDMTEEQASKLLTSKSFHALVKQQFLSNWTLSPERMKQEGAMEEVYSRMSRQFQALSHFSEQVLGKDVFTQLSGTATNMEKNLEFMKTLNQTFQYIQLPLKLQNQNVHGDLYVMTRKESLKKDPKHLKVLLHLDMEHLGTLDIHITRENNAVSTKFFVASKETQNLLERNMDMLKDAINEQGFAFTAELSMKEKDVDIVNDFVAAEAPVGDLKRYNFDLRA